MNFFKHILDFSVKIIFVGGQNYETVDFLLFFTGKLVANRFAWPRPGRPGGTPCELLKSLLEPFSVPLLGNE